MMETTLTIAGTEYRCIDLTAALAEKATTLPYSLKILAENTIRQDPSGASLKAILTRNGAEIPIRPSRLVLQDMLGLPLLVDLMAMRSAIAGSGGNPSCIDMSLPVDLVLDHSLTLEYWGSDSALESNLNREFDINRERFAFMKACEAWFPNLRVFPPGSGIVHQINLEYLGKCVEVLEHESELPQLIPDTNFGTDSHTTMINGIGVLGWGIGGLEAESIMFGEATAINVPRVIGLEVIGRLSHDLTATDVALTVAEQLRTLGVVDCLVELCGSGYANLSATDRATIANMSPEYGATCVYCPIDDNTLRFLRETGRSEQHIQIVEAYARAQGLWFDGSTRDFDDLITLDLDAIKPSVSGPSRPEQRINLVEVPEALALPSMNVVRYPVKGNSSIGDGDVIIAAITSCTNTANPRNMIMAGLLARQAVRLGLSSRPHVKTSLAPGSRVVARYLKASGLQKYLDQLGFHVSAFACSTCNGMSGSLLPEYESAIREHKLNCTAVLSGNRNFAGRIHPLASHNVLASPPLVVAYALAGSVNINIVDGPLGHDHQGRPVTLSDLWPSEDDTNRYLRDFLVADEFRETYRHIADVSTHWNELQVDSGEYQWEPSTNISWPDYLSNIPSNPAPPELKGLRPLVILGDSITTDHITPAGTIPPGSAAADYLESRGIPEQDYNAYGTRRGCSEVVIRSTFSNIRLINEMAPGKEGPWTRLMPESKEVSIFEAIQAYRKRKQRLVVIAGKYYGGGSSRDTSAKAPWLAGVRAVIAESFERIHRSNLVNMGIAPLQFPQEVTRQTLRLDGSEMLDIYLSDNLETARLEIHRANGETTSTPLEIRIYNDQERDIFRQGGMLHKAFRKFIATP